MKSNLSLALAAALVTTSAYAALDLEVRANTTSRVYLGDEYVGDTPLTLSNIRPGSHRIGIENPHTGELKTYATYSSNVAHTSKILRADFGVTTTGTTSYVGPPPHARAYGHRSRRQVIDRGPVARGEVRAHSQVEPRAESRGKTHTRNTLLGLTAASQIFGDEKKDKVRHRNVGLGLTVINELFRR